MDGSVGSGGFYKGGNRGTVWVSVLIFGVSWCFLRVAPSGEPRRDSGTWWWPGGWVGLAWLVPAGVPFWKSSCASVADPGFCLAWWRCVGELGGKQRVALAQGGGHRILVSFDGPVK